MPTPKGPTGDFDSKLRTPNGISTEQKKSWLQTRRDFFNKNPRLQKALREAKIPKVAFINGEEAAIREVEKPENRKLFNKNGTPNIKKPVFSGRGSRSAKATAQTAAKSAGGLINKKNVLALGGLARKGFIPFLIADLALGAYLGTGDYDTLFKATNVLRDDSTLGQGPTGLVKAGENVILVHKSAVGDVESNTEWTRIERPSIKTGKNYYAYAGRPDDAIKLLEKYDTKDFQRYIIPGTVATGIRYDGTPSWNYNPQGEPTIINVAGGPTEQYFVETLNRVFGGSREGFGKVTTEDPDANEFAKLFGDAEKFINSELNNPTESPTGGGNLTQNPNDGATPSFESQPVVAQAGTAAQVAAGAGGVGAAVGGGTEYIAGGGATSFGSQPVAAPQGTGGFADQPRPEQGLPQPPAAQAGTDLLPSIQDLLQGFQVPQVQSEPLDLSGLEEFALKLNEGARRESEQYPTLDTPGKVRPEEVQGIRGNALLDNISTALNSDLDERGAVGQLIVDLLRSPVGQENARRDQTRSEAENLRLTEQFGEDSQRSQDNLSAQVTSEQTQAGLISGLAQTRATERNTTVNVDATNQEAALTKITEGLRAYLTGKQIEATEAGTAATVENTRQNLRLEGDRVQAAKEESEFDRKLKIIEQLILQSQPQGLTPR